jgi:hypothetical protein
VTGAVPRLEALDDREGRPPGTQPGHPNSGTRPATIVPKYIVLISILGCHDDHLRRTARIRRQRSADLLPRPQMHTHHVTLSADRWPNHVRLSDIEPTFTCTACGKRGADVRPKFRSPEMGVHSQPHAGRRE